MAKTATRSRSRGSWRIPGSYRRAPLPTPIPHGYAIHEASSEPQAHGNGAYTVPGTRWGIAGWRPEDGLAEIDPGHVLAVALAVDLEAELVTRVRRPA
jgi:hypothetical protein